MQEKKKQKTEKRIQITDELIQRAKQGDQNAFTELYQLTSPTIYRTIRAMVRDEELSWDIQQNSYIRAFSNLNSLERADAFLPWLRRIAVNVTAREMMQKQPLTFTDLKPESEDGEEEEPLIIPETRPDFQPELHLDRQETSRLVQEILAKLSPEQRMVVGMYYYEGMTIKEIADALHLAQGTVKSNLHRGRRRVETEVKALEQQGVKLYGLSPMLFALTLLRQTEPAAAGQTKVLSGVLTKTAELCGKTVAVTAKPVGTSFFVSIVGKIAAITLGIALAGGTFYGVQALLNRAASPRGDYQPPVTEARLDATQTEPTVDAFVTEQTTQALSQETTEPTEAPESSEPTKPTEPEPTKPTEPEPTKPADPEPTKPAEPEPTKPAEPTPTKPAEPTPTKPTDPTPTKPLESVKPSPSSSEDQEPPLTDDSMQDIQIIEPTPVSEACGENLTWRFDLDTGTLFIEGSGEMNDFHYDWMCAPWYSWHSEIRAVSLPSGLTYIGCNAFTDCTDLREVDLSGTHVIGIGRSAFYGCASLSAVKFPSTLVNISASAFQRCSMLTAADFPANLQIIGDSAFSDCSALTTVHFPAGLVEIGSKAFYGCRSLTELTLQEGLKSIDIYAFSGCYSVKEVHLPQSLTSIGNSAFYNCKDLSKINLPDSLTSLGQYAFCACEKLKEIHIPAGITELAKSAFDDCSGLKTVTFPETLTVIGTDAFSGCTGLESVVLPASLQSIETRAFCGCSSLQEVQLPAGLVTIGESAFHSAAFTSIVIPRSVRTIGNKAFGYTGRISRPASEQNFTIFGYAGTAAQAYAEENEITFVQLQD